MIPRIFDSLGDHISKGKALILYGARRTGKTTLLEKFLSSCKIKYLLDTGDNIRLRELFRKLDMREILEYVGGYKLLAIDEAQEVPEVGKAIKIITDKKKDMFVILTGSSSFEISQQAGEPLTGRKKTLTLYPFSMQELLALHNKHELREHLEEQLIFGSYPEISIAETREKKIELLTELTDSYLLKDILSFDKIRSSTTLLKLLKLLSFQIGNEVSLNELAAQLSIDVKTVGRYLDLLEKTFVIKQLSGFSGNLRKEVTSKSKYFFIDNGIRNSLTSNFNTLENRADVGQLFENFIIMERIKKHSNGHWYGNHHFWRTYSKQEIDLVEEIDGKLFGFEIKYNPRKKFKIPPEWRKNYPTASVKKITKDNYLDFVL